MTGKDKSMEKEQTVKFSAIKKEMDKAEREWLPSVQAAKTWNNDEVTRKAWMYVGAKELVKRLELLVLEEEHK